MFMLLAVAIRLEFLECSYINLLLLGGMLKCLIHSDKNYT